MFLRLSLIFVLLANLSAAFSQTLLEIKEAQLREIQTKERAISDEIEALKLTLTATRAESRAERLRAETDDARDILRATRAALDEKN